MASEPNYSTIDEPYNSLLQRDNAQIGNATNPLLNPALLANQNNTTGTQSPGGGLPSASGSPVVSTPADVSGGSVSSQALDNLTITSWIKSRGYQPKKLGFLLRGSDGYAEFTNVYISGEINALTGHIGGWTINATTLSASSIVLDSGNQRITVGTASPKILIDGASSTIGTSDFASGQLGWRIDGDGSGEFNNIIARGELRTAVFTKDEIHASGGTVLIAGASVLLNNFTSVTSPSSSSLDLADPPSGHAQLFVVNDFLRIKDGSGLDNWLKVTAVSDQTTFYRYTVVKQSGTNGTFYPGTAVVDYKQATNGTILLTSDLSNSPYIDIALTGATPWSGTTVKSRVGNLAGITDALFGALSGYGIYTNNGYFTGNIQGTTITGGTIQTATSGQRIVIAASDNSLRFYDSSSQIIGIGTTSATAFRLDLNAVTNIGMQMVGGNTNATIGLIYSNGNNVSNRAISITQDGSANNTSSAINVIHGGSGEILFGDIQGTGNGISLARTAGSGTAALLKLLSSNATNNQNLLIQKTSTTGSANMVEMTSDDGGTVLYIESTKSSSASPALKIVSATSNASGPALHIVKNGDQYASIIEQTVNSSGNTVGMKMNIANAGAGTEYAFEFAGSEYDGTKTGVSGLTGVLKILTGPDGAVFIPVYNTAT